MVLHEMTAVIVTVLDPSEVHVEPRTSQPSYRSPFLLELFHAQAILWSVT